MGGRSLSTVGLRCRVHILRRPADNRRIPLPHRLRRTHRLYHNGQRCSGATTGHSHQFQQLYPASYFRSWLNDGRNAAQPYRRTHPECVERFPRCSSSRCRVRRDDGLRPPRSANYRTASRVGCATAIYYWLTYVGFFAPFVISFAAPKFGFVTVFIFGAIIALVSTYPVAKVANSAVRSDEASKSRRD